MREWQRGGTTRLVTECCGVEPKTMGSYGNYYKQCPQCGGGSFYRDVDVVSNYIPSTKEMELERRIEALENEIAALKHRRVGGDR